MARVTERDARLLAFVGAVLQRNNVLASSELLLGEISNILVGFLRPDGRLSEVTRLPAEGLQASDDRIQILLLPKVDSLEGLLRGDAQLLNGF